MRSCVVNAFNSFVSFDRECSRNGVICFHCTNTSRGYSSSRVLQVALDMLEFEQSGAFQYADCGTGTTANVGA